MRASEHLPQALRGPKGVGWASYFPKFLKGWEASGQWQIY